MPDEQPVALKKIKKSIAVVEGCTRCIIHYHRNVMEKEVGRLTEASFLRFDDLQMFVKRRRILHCVLMISASYFLSILIPIFTVVTSGVIVSTLISHGCWKENIRQVNTHRNQLQHLSRQPGVPRKKKWIAISTKECFFVWKRPQEVGVIHRWFVVVAEEAIKERTREKCDFRHTNLKKNW